MAIHLVRHATAGRRSYDASVDDSVRHLDETGLSQSEGLDRYFADFPLNAVWSSEATRCVETVEPTAATHGLAVVNFAELTEGANPNDLINLLRARADTAGDLVACSHGDLIPETISRLVMQGTSLSGPRGCEKGSIWTLQTSGHDIVSASYTAQPWLTDRR